MALSVALPPVAGGCSVGGPNRGPRLDDDVFGSLALLLGSSHASPSPSSSSESSGIGSLGSLKSDSLPSSPHSVDKKLFDEEPLLALPKPKQPKEGPIRQTSVKVGYQGRDLLNLFHNMRDGRWQFSPAYLPPSNPTVFFENRSQYHRLGSLAPPEFITDKCRECSFQWVVAVVD